MFYLITHGLREGFGNPPQTLEGIAQMQDSLITEYVMKLLKQEGGVPLIIYGEGERFWGSYICMTEVLPQLKDVLAIPSPVFGTPTSTTLINNVRYAKLWNGKLVLLSCRLGLERIETDWWRFLKKNIPDNSLIFSGAEFLQKLGLSREECHCCSFWAIDPCRRRAHCLVCRGKRT